jgi:hypothetical protein
MTYPNPVPPAPVGNNKAIAATVAGAVVIIASWAVGYFTKVVVPAEVWTSAQTIIVSALVYYVPHGG